MSALFGLLGLLIIAVSLICLVYPIRAIGIPTRRRAGLLLLAGFASFIVGVKIYEPAPVPAPSTTTAQAPASAPTLSTPPAPSTTTAQAPAAPAPSTPTTQAANPKLPQAQIRRIVDVDLPSIVSDASKMVAPEKGDWFVLKNVRIRMEDTRHVEALITYNRLVREYMHVKVADLDPDLLALIKDKCSTIGVHDEARKKSIQQNAACKLNLVGQLDSSSKSPFHSPKVGPFEEQRGNTITYYFSQVRLASPEEIDPPATPVTAVELKANARKYAGQWVSMDSAIVRYSPSGALLERSTFIVELPGTDNVVRILDGQSSPATPNLEKQIKARCYREIEFKDIYKPEECTFPVKFRVKGVTPPSKKGAPTGMFANPAAPGDIVAEYFSILAKSK